MNFTIIRIGEQITTTGEVGNSEVIYDIAITSLKGA